MATTERDWAAGIYANGGSLADHIGTAPLERLKSLTSISNYTPPTAPVRKSTPPSLSQDSSNFTGPVNTESDEQRFNRLKYEYASLYQRNPDTLTDAERNRANVLHTVLNDAGIKAKRIGGGSVAGVNQFIPGNNRMPDAPAQLGFIPPVSENDRQYQIAENTKLYNQAVDAGDVARATNLALIIHDVYGGKVTPTTAVRNELLKKNRHDLVPMSGAVQRGDTFSDSATPLHVDQNAINSADIHSLARTNPNNMQIQSASNSLKIRDVQVKLNQVLASIQTLPPDEQSASLVRLATKETDPMLKTALTSRAKEIQLGAIGKGKIRDPEKGAIMGALDQGLNYTAAVGSGTANYLVNSAKAISNLSNDALSSVGLAPAATKYGPDEFGKVLDYGPESGQKVGDILGMLLTVEAASGLTSAAMAKFIPALAENATLAQVARRAMMEKGISNTAINTYFQTVANYQSGGNLKDLGGRLLRSTPLAVGLGAAEAKLSPLVQGIANPLLKKAAGALEAGGTGLGWSAVNTAANYGTPQQQGFLKEAKGLVPFVMAMHALGLGGQLFKFAKAEIGKTGNLTPETMAKVEQYLAENPEAQDKYQSLTNIVENKPVIHQVGDTVYANGKKGVVKSVMPENGTVTVDFTKPDEVRPKGFDKQGNPTGFTTMRGIKDVRMVSAEHVKSEPTVTESPATTPAQTAMLKTHSHLLPDMATNKESFTVAPDNKTPGNITNEQPIIPREVPGEVAPPVNNSFTPEPVVKSATGEVVTEPPPSPSSVAGEVAQGGGKVSTIAGKMNLTEFENNGYTPDQVTQQDWINLQRANRRSLGQQEGGDSKYSPNAEYEEYHKQAVSEALAKDPAKVDPVVVVDYPDLAKKYGITIEQSSPAPHAPADAEVSGEAGKGAAGTPDTNGKPYYLYNPVDKSFVPVENAKPVKVPGAEGLDLFINKDAAGKWNISEGKTGAKVAVGDTRKGAVDKLAAVINLHGVDALNKVLDASVQKTGVSPRYTENAPQPALLGKANDQIGQPDTAKVPANAHKGEVNVNALTGGVAELIKQDIIPGLKIAGHGLAQNSDQLTAAFSPGSRGDLAGQAARSLRANPAKMARELDIVRGKLEAFGKIIDKLPEADQLRFIDRMEKNQPQLVNGKADPALTKLASTIRKELDNRWQIIQKLRGSEAFIENYFPHYWKEKSPSQNFLQRMLGAKRPLEGPKSFLKMRTIPTTADGMRWRVYDENGKMLDTFDDEAGAKALAATNEKYSVGEPLTPITTNPIELSLLKMHEMDKYIMARHVIDELKKTGGLVFVAASKAKPSGLVEVNDKFATIYGGFDKEGALRVRGRYYAPEPVAKVLNNYLTPGLRGKSTPFDAYRATANVMNQVQLGLSAYHFTFTVLDSMTSTTALGIRQLGFLGLGGIKGQRLEGALNILKTPVAPALNFARGMKLKAEYYAPGTQGKIIADQLNAMLEGGYRYRMDSRFKNDSIKSFMRAWRSGNVLGAGWRAPFAFIEATAKPLMEQWVPMMKAGIAADMAHSELRRLGGKATADQLREVMAKAIDSVDNRMGQLQYDNLFWSNTLKDVLQASQRSLGWNIGTIRELGGGLIDPLKQTYKAVRGELNGEPFFTHRTSYVIALPIVMGILGAMYQKLRTGKNSESLLDLYAPRNGNTNKDGSEDRVQFASYMKDVLAYGVDIGYLRHGDIVQGTKTLQHKANPLISSIFDMLTNEDFYGNKIRNMDDPAVKKWADTGKYLLKQFIPFSGRNAEYTLTEKGGGYGKSAETVFGITPASAHIRRSRAQNLLSDILQNNYKLPPLSPEDAAANAAKAPFRAEILAAADKDNAESELDKIAAKMALPTSKGGLGYAEHKAVKYINSTLTSVPGFPRFGGLKWQDAAKVWEKATPKERDNLEEPFRKKLENALNNKDNSDQVKDEVLATANKYFNIK